MKKDCYGVNSEESLVKAREAARQAGTCLVPHNSVLCCSSSLGR